MIEKESYKGYELYYSKKKIEYKSILKKICKKEYAELEIYKNTERNYVAKIEVEGNVYILKSPKAETVIPQRRIQTYFKDGEALVTLKNLTHWKSIGLDFFVPPLGVIVKKSKFIEESYILMEYIEGEILRTTEDVNEVMKIIKKMHSHGIYHGDLNTSNFINTKEGMKVIDTQGKSEKYIDYKRCYDVFTLKRDLLTMSLNYDVEKEYYRDENNRDIKRNKSLFYYIAYFIKEFKNIPIISKIRGLKQKLRVKGWKI
ncbi:MAG: lipopolysaccharide core heptose(II) kinase RfaY [Fusobacteriaceae bacterium]